MAEMAELCELYEESKELQMDVLPGEGDMEAGRPRRRAPGGGGRAVRRPPSAASSPRLARTWKATSLTIGRTTMTSLKRSAGVRDAQGVRCAGGSQQGVLRTARAGEAMDGGFQARCEKSPCDQLLSKSCFR